MTILAVGCSFLCDRSRVRPQCAVMAERLDQPLDNRSIPGNGNTHILYNTMTAIIENPNKYSLVVIGWSNPGRWDFVTAPHKWFALKIGNIIHTATNKRVNFALSLFRHWAPQVVLLSSWLRARNIPFIMWNSLECWHDSNSALHREILGMPEFYKPTISHIADLRQKQQWISKDDHHPNQVSHDEWASELLKFYNTLYK
jgi:hypothetical protein